MEKKQKKTVQDNQGRDWSLSITLGSAELMRQRHDLDIAEALDGNFFTKLFLDTKFLINVMETICESQIRAKDISTDDFLDSFDGDQLDDIRSAITESVVAFTPSHLRPSILAVIKEVGEGLRQAGVAGQKGIMKEMKKATAEMVSELSTYGQSQDRAPHPSDSGQQPGPSES